MKDIESVWTHTWYRARSAEMLARRLYGRAVTVRAEHSDAWSPAYRMWTVTDRHGTVYDRLYEPLYEGESESESESEDEEWDG